MAVCQAPSNFDFSRLPSRVLSRLEQPSFHRLLLDFLDLITSVSLLTLDGAVLARSLDRASDHVARARDSLVALSRQLESSNSRPCLEEEVPLVPEAQSEFQRVLMKRAAIAEQYCKLRTGSGEAERTQELAA